MFKKKHRFIENVASCKHKSIMSKEETIIKLTTMNIVWDEVDEINYFEDETLEEVQYYSKN